jgi:hypothetical protein
VPLAQLKNIRLYYEEHGHSPPLMLAHGHACGVRSWDPQLRGLTDQYRVIVYDSRGHGLSEAPDEMTAYSQLHMVEDLYGLMDHLRLITAGYGRAIDGRKRRSQFRICSPEARAGIGAGAYAATAARPRVLVPSPCRLTNT